jgi:predicted ATPase
MSINVVKGRNLDVLGYQNVARLNFKKVFNGTYGASDFIAITKNFQAIFLEDIT